MKALEDLSAGYDLSVQNAIGGVVQFKYGDDGLDPASMEGDQVPVDLKRNLLHCQTVERENVSSGLLPWEIRRIVKDTFEPIRKKDENEAFLDSVSHYIEQNVTRVLIDIRLKRGLSEGISCNDMDEGSFIIPLFHLY